MQKFTNESVDERMTPNTSDLNEIRIKEEDVISQSKLIEDLNLDRSSKC